MDNNSFVVFILTHGRPHNVKTVATLKRCGYIGKIYFVVDNEDKKANEYINIFGVENVKVFDKKIYADQIDEANNFDERRTITHARNACFDIAKELGITYFIQLDDDYTDFRYKLVETNNSCFIIKDLNKVFNLFFNYYRETNCLSIAFAQNGDFIGGFDNGKGVYRFPKRKCMNSFFCSTDRKFQFIGAMNEDVNTYTSLGNRGNIFLNIPFVALNQTQTQGNKGGITDMYLKYGTYCKAFTTTMMHPSGVKVSMMQAKHIRIHHAIKWVNTTPMIINEKHKKV